MSQLDADANHPTVASNNPSNLQGPATTRVPRKALVTGGAGFIGSHIVDELVRGGGEVVVYDDFRTGFKRYLEWALSAGRCSIVEGDILDRAKLTAAMRGVDAVFHLAANADVRGGAANTRIDLEQNVLGTVSVLEAMRLTGASQLVFTSSATVYGEPERYPTPEDYAGLQTSVYGASKLAAEAYIQAFGEYFGIRSHVFRFVSWIGERYSHGVVYDFVRKLMSNPKQLEILGDGHQRKSYLHVEDGVRGVFLALDKFTEVKNIVNLGHEEIVAVTEVARIVCDEMGLNHVAFDFTGGRRGWLGDSPVVLLDIAKMKRAGFRPEIGVEEGIRRTARYLLENRWIFDARKGRD
jgi:UDP-glucose 4-epimerase